MTAAVREVKKPADRERLNSCEKCGTPAKNAAKPSAASRVWNAGSDFPFTCYNRDSLVGDNHDS